MAKQTLYKDESWFSQKNESTRYRNAPKQRPQAPPLDTLIDQIHHVDFAKNKAIVHLKNNKRYIYLDNSGDYDRLRSLTGLNNILARHEPTSPLSSLDL